MTEHPRHPSLPDASANREGRRRIVVPAAASLAAQWTGFFLAPATFFAHLQVAYVLVPWTCFSGNHLWIHVAGAASVVLAAIGTAIAWTVWTRERDVATTDGGGPDPRALFLGITGTVMGATFVLLLAAQWAAAFIISPCQ